MKGIAIYVEGGGDTAQQKAELRTGFDELLSDPKQAARAKRLRWRLVPSGGRDAVFKAFINSNESADDQTLCVLLVDAEDELPPEKSAGTDESEQDHAKRLLQNAKSRRDHLARRDNWAFSGIDPERVHLMVRCMEAWIVADPEAMQTYYGNEFRANQLPNRIDLEDEPKLHIYDKLKKATKDTSKGEYAKIAHASKLLACVDSSKITARCPRFATFVNWLSAEIENA